MKMEGLSASRACDVTSFSPGCSTQCLRYTGGDCMSSMGEHCDLRSIQTWFPFTFWCLINIVHQIYGSFLIIPLLSVGEFYLIFNSGVNPDLDAQDTVNHIRFTRLSIHICTIVIVNRIMYFMWMEPILCA